MNVLRACRAALLWMPILLLSACSTGSPKAVVEKPGDVGSGEVILVGRVEFVPPLGPDDQQLTGSGKQYKDKVLLVTDERPRRIENLRPGDLKDRIEASLREPFYVKSGNRPLYIVGAVVVMQKTLSWDPGRLQLPASYKIDIRPGDKAVYVGTLRYHRDEFFGITRIEVIDSYARAEVDFRKRFGAHLLLRKSLMHLVKP
jgi:hypothetical protein